MSSVIYIDQIVTSILKAQKNINTVKNFELLKMIDYTKENHQKIKALIAQGQIDELKELSGIKLDVNQGYDLIIVKFSDYQDKPHLAIVYDSADLWQDPQTLEVIPLPFQKVE
jgi:hypothetical protein